jgi:hypothetical protein
MTLTKLVAIGSLAAVVAAAPSAAQAQARTRGRPAGRGPAVVGQAVPRGPAPPAGRTDRATVVPYRPSYRPGLRFDLWYGYPEYYYRPYTAYGYAYAYPSYAYPSHGYPYGYGYGSSQAPGYVTGGPVQAYGGVRIDIPQREAEVYADGYFAGTVDDFDGVMQRLDLTAGPHHLEIRADGYAPVAFDVNVMPGQTVTYRTDLRPLRP